MIKDFQSTTDRVYPSGVESTVGVTREWCSAVDLYFDPRGDAGYNAAAVKFYALIGSQEALMQTSAIAGTATQRFQGPRTTMARWRITITPSGAPVTKASATLFAFGKEPG